MPSSLAALRVLLSPLAVLLAYTACVSTETSSPETFVDLRKHWDFSDPAAFGPQFEKLVDGEKTTIARIRVELERGRAHNGIPGATDPEADARKQRARPFFLRAYELARNSGQDALALDAAHMMGIIEPPDEALRWSHQAIALAEQAEDPRARGWLGPLYNNTGWTYHDLGEYERALELF